MVPPRLEQGGVIGICSPSHIADRAAYAGLLEAIQRMGFRTREAKNLYSASHGYAASPEERAADFNELIADPSVGLVLFGGGEGSGELLPYIDFEAVRRSPKCICSYSDGTTILNAVWAKTGLTVYYGQAPGFFPDMSAYDRAQFVQHLMGGGSAHVKSCPWRTLVPGAARGVLVGGYARNFAMLLLSRYFPLDRSRKYILFLEDHERFGGVDYVSAMLAHIEQDAFIDSVAGMLFGHYADDVPQSLLDRLERFGLRHGVPVAYCDDFGHGENHAILPIGRPAVLDTARCTLRYGDADLIR